MKINFIKIFNILEQNHKPTMLEQLKSYSPFQLLIATLLSSRTKDTTTIPIVKKLFEKYPEVKDFVNLKLEILKQELYGVGFHNVKANNIKKLSKIILKKYNNKIPDNITELILLPGVGKKTANCLLNYAFKKPAIAVDIHVHRISNRIGWVSTKNEEQTEKELMKIIPQKLWIKVNKLLVNHGQKICLPRKPQCDNCKIIMFCNYKK